LPEFRFMVSSATATKKTSSERIMAQLRLEIVVCVVVMTLVLSEI